MEQKLSPDSLSLSVAMASYNGERYISQQIDSILSQLRPQDELIISDDGSTDKTVDIIRGYAQTDSRIKLLHGPGQGVMKNFGHALSACRGDILCLCDQDDLWHPDKVDSLLQCFCSTGAVLVMHDARIVDAGGRPLAPSFFATRHTKAGFFKNLWKNSYIGCCMSFRRELLRIILPIPEGIPMHDQFIGLLAEQQGHVELIPRPLIDYRRHGNNVSGDHHGSFSTMVSQRISMFRAVMSRRKQAGI